ncbi:MAG: D-alanine--D-alanine ligase family protein [Planctomycetota bacterium]
MLIGLTYDLRSDYLALGYSQEEVAEFDCPETIEGIENALRAAGHETDRIGHGRCLVERLVAGDRWDLVFNIAEGLHGIAREAQVPAILDLYQVPYTFSDPVVLGVCLQKGLAKALVRQAGVPTPDFAVVEALDDVEQIALDPPLFAKPVAEGTSKGISAASLIGNRASLSGVCEDLLARFRQPVLVESFLPGREFTVGLVGTGPKAEVIGAMEVILLEQAEAGSYSYANKAQWEGRVAYRLADPSSDREACEAAELALKSWRALGCRDGGRVDVRSNATGQPQFVEVNPLPGLNPTYSDLPLLSYRAGWNYEQLIARIVESAIERMATGQPTAA